MTAVDDETEIEASRAPLMEHLIELRRRLIVCAAALAIGFFATFVSEIELQWVESPAVTRAGGSPSAS